MKAITPVIATVMLMLITVGMVGITYTWFSGMLASNTEKVLTIPIGGALCINNRISVIGTNSGANSNITDDDIVVADINGVNVRNTPFFGGFNTNGLVGYWRFEGDARDYSSSKNDGTVTGATLTNSQFGSAYRFNGGNNKISLINEITMANGAGWSLSLWVNLNSSSYGDGWWQSWIGGTSYYRQIGTNDATQLLFETDSGDNGVDQVTKLWSWNTANFIGKWTHIVFVGGTGNTCVTAYSNGASLGSSCGTRNNFLFKIMGQTGTAERKLNGTLDEVAIWNRVLTQDEITQLNKTNSGNFTLAPNKAVTLINGYPVFSKGKYTVRIVTRNGVMERTVECL